jgi:general secretion pathway protein A
MYESFYGFQEKPFSLLPDPAFLYLGKQHSAAFAMLEYGLMHQVGITVITGDIGTGKTSLVRYLLDKLDDNITFGLISNTHHSQRDLMSWVALAFGLEHRNRSSIDLYESFVDFLMKHYTRGRRTVLIIDEAQNMNDDTLEELRMLSNINTDKDHVLQLILTGQPELRGMLRKPGLEQFTQRIAASFHLEPLGAEDIRSYIGHRLRVAGGNPDLFDDSACAMIYEHSRGIPRIINILCDTALVYSYSEQEHKIDAKIVAEVINDKLKGGMFPTESGEDQETEDYWPRDPKLANSLNNIANVYRTQGKYEEAEANYKRAVNILENSVGSQHPNLATVLNNLAVLYRKQGKYSEAESLYRRALAIVEKALGPEHRNVAMSLNNLAILFQKQGKFTEAEPIQKRALLILEKALGPDHPDVAKGLRNLAKLQSLMGSVEEAEKYQKRAVAIEKGKFRHNPNPTATLSQASAKQKERGSNSVTLQKVLRPVPTPSKKQCD